eukprot:TRINITY_DN4019_c0_g1_i2.p1 TRINITY_DN4019_c0_g1~~TRINITY_DN4019_c0_g1_i2.p1  ORF type:complete len:1029 (+),score=204.55 TRINITY_DN4019_c0_g1_i2:415-3087(+)
MNGEEVTVALQKKKQKDKVKGTLTFTLVYKPVLQLKNRATSLDSVCSVFFSDSKKSVAFTPKQKVMDVLLAQCRKRKVSLDDYDVMTHDGLPLNLNSLVQDVPERVISLRPKKAKLNLWNGDLKVNIDSAVDLMKGDYDMTNPCCFLYLHSDSGRVFIDGTVRTKAIKLTTKPFWQQTFTFPLRNVPQQKMHLSMHVFDKRLQGAPVFIGAAHYSWDSFDNPTIGKKQTLPLVSRKDRKEKIDSGELTFAVDWVPNTKPRGTVRVLINEVLSAPKGKHCIVRIVSGFDTWTTDYGNVIPSPIGDGFKFRQELELEGMLLEDNIRLEVHCSSKPILGKAETTWYAKGSTDFTLKEFISKPEWTLLLGHPKTENAVTDPSGSFPTQLLVKVSVKPDEVPEGWPTPKPRAYDMSAYPKHILMISRGTQGDVQPFMAMARGLAEEKGWMVTFVTEQHFKPFVLRNSAVSRGAIRFRPSGGNTDKTIDKPISKWAMQTQSEVMQATMLARSEVEFFGSEPYIYHWASVMKPDAIIYGFTMASIALLLCEALHIPIIGFILQPTSIPSSQYTPVVPIKSGEAKKLSLQSAIDIIEKRSVGGTAQKVLRAVNENVPGQSLSEIRSRRGLKTKSITNLQTAFHIIVKRNLPIIVPMVPYAFGGKPADWHEKAVFTDFIFLRSGGVGDLTPEFKQFIGNAKEKGRKLVVMGFSSMPVPRDKILEIACSMCSESQCKPCVIALVGRRPPGEPPLSPELQQRTQALKDEGSLLEAAGAPFGKLFPEMDTIIVHGGLGTTAEAMRAGVPVMITGVLLMDQRFWGLRTYQMGIGPEPVHIKAFQKDVVKNLDKALAPGSEWAKVAKELPPKISGKTEDGVQDNIDAVEKLLNEWVSPFGHHKN